MAKTEPSITLELEHGDKILRDRIDTLIIQKQLWVLVVESKGSLSFSIGLPQVMAYMMANPHPESPVYAIQNSLLLCLLIRFSIPLLIKRFA